MTYKKIVNEMLKRDSVEWVRELMKKNNIDHRWIDAGDPYIERRTDDMLYSVKLTVTMRDYEKKELEVGGSIDDLIGLCHSCVLDASNGHILWMNVPDTRKLIGITEFQMP